MEGYGLDHHDQEPNVPEHYERCCDCMQEYFGVPARLRKRPRIQSNNESSE